MVDTLRTKTELLTIFKDGQVDGSITPQDLRDLIVSITPAYGAMYFSSTVETVILLVNTKTTALGTTTLITTPNQIDMPQNNRLRYTGDEPRTFIIDASISSTTAGNNKTIQYQIFKNGVALIETLMTRVHGTGADHGVIALTTNVLLSQNDYIELHVSNETDTTNLTIENGIINLLGFIQ